MKVVVSFIVLLICCVFIFESCKDEVDKSDMYTFTGQMASDYIKSNPDLSMFAKILRISHNNKTKNSSSVLSLIGTIGNYTIFAPNNDAIQLYLDSLYGPGYNIDTMPRDVADRIVLTSIIDRGKEQAYSQNTLYEGYMTEGTLDKHHLNMCFGEWGNGCRLRINNKSRVLKGNIRVDNGYILIIDRVIENGPSTLPGLISTTDNLKIFSMLLNRTGWADSMLQYEDEKYKDSVYPALQLEYPLSYTHFPPQRLYGYTAFTETDDVFAREWSIPTPVTDPETGGIKNMQEIFAMIEQKCREIYPDAKSNDYTSEDNAINQFVSYHLLPFKRVFNHLVYRYGNEYGFLWYTKYKDIPEDKWGNGGRYHIKYQPADIWTYYQTMGKPHRIMKILRKAKTNEYYINRHGYRNTAYDGDYTETSCDYEGAYVQATNPGYENKCLNGMYLPIDKILAYDDYTRNITLNERIRYDMTNCFPEINTDYIEGTSFKLRGGGTTQNPYKQVDRAPRDYCNNFIFNDPYVTYGRGEGFFEGDRFLLTGNDYIFKLLPVPFDGVWEIRIGTFSTIFEIWIGENTTKINQMKYINKYDTRFFERTIEGLNPSGELKKGVEFILCDGFRIPREKEIIIEEKNFSPFFWELYDSTTIKENDHQCRLHGFMKYPYSIGEHMSSSLTNTDRWRSLRWYIGNRRNIIYKGYMKANADYYMRIKNNFNNTCRGDMIEMVPEHLISHEDFW